VIYQGDVPTLKVWAPTAQAVGLQLFDSSSPTAISSTVPLTADPATGVWSVTGSPDWTGKFYLYDVTVFARAAGKVVHNLVTDPYSVSLATNSLRSQIVDLADPRWMPDGWQTLHKPPLASVDDIVLYELHLRDFSINDPTVAPAHRGTYLAFTEPASNGMQHLKALAAAGLTHIHLLPVFDFATVNEDPAARSEADPALLAQRAPDSQQQQQMLSLYRDLDGFNWGYDPYHYGVPEGSYATHPDGAARIREFRAMVQGLSDSGLRVVLDVVYNHTTASGQDPKSVLDRIVPGYYHRLDADGNVENSTCCANTASEHAMMEKLMIDTTVQWARAYKVDGFRFDLMGHHMVANMVKLRDALQALTLAKDGVDGSKIYLYGEGWNFGEVADNKRGVNATQINLAGTGIGTFNDRIRDAARGGGPFNGPQEQGFIDGLATAPNGTDQGTAVTQTHKLLQYMDWIRVGLAGNLKEYPLVDHTGQTVTGAQVDYNGQPAGYTAAPQEDVNYVEAHDNETLWDAIAYKAPVTTSLADRVRMQNLGVDLVSLGQGIPFFHAGVDMLRSKSLDGNSYNSGDWFNRLDFSYTSNNWGVGLPPKENGDTNWPIMRPLLANPALKPAKADILGAVAHFQEMLRIRKSSKLFRLETAAAVKDRVRFLNTGPTQVPGLIVMSLADLPAARVDPVYGWIVVVFNATATTQRFADPVFAGADLVLHPIQRASADPVVRSARFNAATRTLTVPARTTAVFVSAKPGPAVSLAIAGQPGSGSGAGPRSLLPGSGRAAGPGWWWLMLGAAVILAGLGLRRGRRAPRA
ncbi:MAG TPA: pullulanase-type alpha-1,6-glucosidase, partial [Chloroflexia bacterium]|nr:pullulanase-type alpha-1,6-glucosidase [Chloroflexia bacterium]